MVESLASPLTLDWLEMLPSNQWMKTRNKDEQSLILCQRFEFLSQKIQEEKSSQNIKVVLL